MWLLRYCLRLRPCGYDLPVYRSYGVYEALEQPISGSFDEVCRKLVGYADCSPSE